MAVFERPARHLPARALQWQAGRSRSGEAGGRYLEKEFHRVLHKSQRWGLHRGSPESHRLVHLNPTSVATSPEANRYRLEKMGMTG